MTHSKKLDRLIVKNCRIINHFRKDKIVFPLQTDLLKNIENIFVSCKKELILYLLPNIISFLRYIKSITDSETLICFVSRDCYFLNKLYSIMYPNDDNYQYVYCSRKMFYSKSKNVVNYIKRIVNTKKKTLWVDIQGSGDSHAYFFKKHFGSIPNKIYYTLNSLQLMSKGLKKDCSLSISDYHLFSGFTKNDFSGEYNLKNYCDFVEGLCRSPTQSIIDIEGEQAPIYSKKKDYQDDNLDTIIKTYDYILENWWVQNNINLRVDTNLFNVNFKLEKNWNYLLAFDIDETVTMDEHHILEPLVDYCNYNKIKIIFITARWDPFYKNHNGYLKDILELFLIKMEYPIDLWYNPFSKNNTLKEHIGNCSFIKFRQLELARQELELSSEKCFFIDDKKENVFYMLKNGYSNCFQTGEKGISPFILDNIRTIIEKDIKYKLIYR